MKLFQFDQMFLFVPKFERSCSITQTWLRVLKFAPPMFLILCKFKWSIVYYPNGNKAV